MFHLSCVMCDITHVILGGGSKWVNLVNFFWQVDSISIKGRGIVCGTDKFRETWIYTVIQCLWNWHIVCEADIIVYR